MKNVMVSYKLKPECVAENEALIDKVFEQLARDKPAQLRYGVFKLPDGVSFVHVAESPRSGEESPLMKLDAFQRYLAGIKDRVVAPPERAEGEALGYFDGFA